MVLNEKKLDAWVEREFNRAARNIIVSNNGSYIVFGKYFLESSIYGCRVSSWSDEIFNFSNKRTAVSWCVADKYHQYRLANNIRILDAKKQLLVADIQCRRGQAQRGDHEDFYELVETKIQPKQAALEAINTELEKCINSAKYLQLRGFNNETA